ncbi:hypothetical protein [Haloferax volcanii]|uniref:Uncharacterized protein n=1 Tax=Haloferax volcanii TaxID=2246 RepID=A0A8T5CRX3_HALVO|nr:hypothetical protein [Haloferax volcanii]MBS8120788.1 hypothetical protein [Haloferax volcanii]MBS8125825.1 hypothetical protein [Haloferax volcanii]MBS8129678.1 hypothetical protein [Haloferax volcanii]MBS8133543.1 hypothetical protein [Haloferax volcanii]MDW7537528.1 hypothetical protein [Haloferax volcanii]
MGDAGPFPTSNHVIASYVAYPVLEGIAKRYCHEYIHENGTVKEGKSIHTYDPVVRAGEQVNNIGWILSHIENVAGSPELKEEMRQMRIQVADFYSCGENQVYGTIAGYRNTWLHGEEVAIAEYGTLMNYISLLLWAMMFEK